MNRRSYTGAHRASAERPRKRALRLFPLAASVVVVALVALAYDPRAAQSPSIDTGVESLGLKRPVPEAVEFRMTDFERGWLKFSDGVVKVTDDGGAQWREVPPEEAERAMSGDGGGTGRGEWSLAAPAADNLPNAIVYDTKRLTVRQVQFMTERIGWALPEGAAGGMSPLLVTTDGGRTWQGEMTSAVKEAVQAEKRREAQVALEAALYDTPDKAKQAMRSAWTILPKQASPGDAVLVRSGKAGKVEWQGKTYELRPFGSGYYTYLPIPMSAKPGNYPIGEETLTIKAKTFDTQYLQVSQQMESMKQDTERIQADQKKIDAARSKSESEFLFTSAFIQPIQGILTTPYGHTRYVNGKYDSSHMAIDLAAKEGTPIKATNDGVVALADSLYLTGNSIYLDHGMGLFSQYAHLSELRVKTGDRVKKGDIIGLVGTTGFSTGPHLHFTFWVHNVQANPNLFFDKTPMQWSAAQTK